MSVEQIITDNIDLWTSALKKKSATGRGSTKKIELYGIKKLRELILELAVRGKLVPQGADDEPANELLKRIADKKAQLVKSKLIKKSKVLPEISDAEKPYSLPKGWVFLRLSDSYYSISPSGKKLKTTDIKAEGAAAVVDQGQKYIAGYTDAIDLKVSIPHAVIVFGDHTRNIKHIDFDFVAGADGTKILCPLVISTKYFYHYLKSYNLESRGYGRHFKILNDNLIAIPPLVEQHRIVSKIEELMELCDQLESQTENSIEAHKTLVEVLLATLTDAKDADELSQNWLRVSEHFDTLFTTEHSIDQLKQTILQLAVMGKLVPQDPTDEPASVLLEKIAAEKEQLIKDKKIKKQKALPLFDESLAPFELPNGWEWCRLEDVVDIQSGITKGRKLKDRETIVIPYLSVANVQRSYLELSFVKEVEIPKEELDKYKVLNGDLLITEGGDWDKVGRTAIWRDELPYVGHQNHVFKARCFIEEQSEVWLEKYLNSSFCRDYFAGSSKQTTNLASINKTQLRGCLIAVPPTNEKFKILTKLEHLLVVCDQLLVKIQLSQQTQLHLADAVVENSLN